MTPLHDCPELAGVYVLRCRINGKVYVGSSKNMRQRLLAHWNALHGQYHQNLVLQQDYTTYGETAFDWRILSMTKVGQDQANLEWEWIQWFDACNPRFGYNRTEWAVGISGVIS